MILLQAANIAMSFGARRVLDGVTLAIREGERAGIVGVNGAGKSTLLKILAGRLTAERGEVVRAGDISVAYLAQDGGLESGRSIREEMLAAFSPLLAMERELGEMEKKMGDPALTADTAAHRQLLRAYDDLAARFKSRGGFEYEARIRGVLHGLNFGNVDGNTPARLLSGGQKTRLALARCLLGEPDLLLLDEPTNYLDMDNLAWLERHLQSFRGAVLVVSHDRYFLDALVKVIYELDGARLTRYTGNYTGFVRQKAEAAERRLKEYNRQQKEIARLEDFVRRNIAAAATTGRAQSRLKTLEKMERLDRPGQERRVALSLGAGSPGGREVLRVKDLTAGYPGRPLVRGLEFGLDRGERAVLMGPNGIGKSTLLKTIAGLLPPLEGSVRLGGRIRIGYYGQEQQELHGEKQVLHELWDRYPRMTELDIRTVLGRFLFSGDDVKKTVADLSGGEKSRLALAALMLRGANFLLLDEPTNHLDLPAREALEEALAGYPGTILFVSHDRYFIKKTATRVLELGPDGLTSHPGGYEYYIERKCRRDSGAAKPATGKGGPETAPGVTPEAAERKSVEKELYLRRKEEERQKRRRLRRIEELERAIAGLEEQTARLEGELYLPEVYRDHQACRAKQDELARARAALESHMEEWLALVEE